MRYYLLQNPEFFTDYIEVTNFHKQVDYRSFYNDRLYEIPPDLILMCRHKVYAQYQDIVLDPLPLFSKNAWDAVDLFMGNIAFTHLILMDEATKEHRDYYCPAFRRVEGGGESIMERGMTVSVRIQLAEPMPEDLSFLYLMNRGKIQILAGLDILEALMRRGLCDLRLLPVEFMGGQAYGRV